MSFGFFILVLLVVTSASQSVAEAKGSAGVIETLSCDVAQLAGSGELPSNIVVRLQPNQAQAVVSSTWITESQDRPTIASVSKKSTELIVLRWQVEYPDGNISLAPITVKYRAVLNMQNLKFTLLEFNPDGRRVRLRGAGTCMPVEAGRFLLIPGH